MAVKWALYQCGPFAPHIAPVSLVAAFPRGLVLSLRRASSSGLSLRAPLRRLFGVRSGVAAGPGVRPRVRAPSGALGCAAAVARSLARLRARASGPVGGGPPLRPPRGLRSLSRGLFSERHSLNPQAFFNLFLSDSLRFFFALYIQAKTLPDPPKPPLVDPYFHPPYRTPSTRPNSPSCKTAAARRSPVVPRKSRRAAIPLSPTRTCGASYKNVSLRSRKSSAILAYYWLLC